MKRRVTRIALGAARLSVWCGALALAAAAADSDVILRAMRDELNRSLALRLVSLEAPYYIAYQVDDGEFYSGSATLGALVGSGQLRARLPRIQVRVGSYDFDSTNYVASGFVLGSRYDVDRLPLDDDYLLLRRYLWLGTDQAYKSAIEIIARKRAALKNLSTADPPLADFARAEKSQVILERPAARFDIGTWQNRVRALSGEFAKYPQITASSVDFQATRSTRYLVTSEDTEVRVPETLFTLHARAAGLAGDGMRLRDAASFHAVDLNRTPSEDEIAQEIRRLAENVTALTRAPLGEPYSGPVLFEGIAGGQLLAELIGRNLALTRKPVTEPGRPGTFPTSDLEGRLGARILPEWMDIIDDPTQTEWRGKPLIGFYRVDEEGMVPKPLALVEKGTLKNYVLTRLPVRGFPASNGRARFPGNFGTHAAAFTNLFVRADQTASLADLRKKMLELCQARGRAYGVVVRKMDFPSSAGSEEVRRLLANGSAGSAHPVSLPILVYRFYPDGREELVRGLRFKGLNARSLKDIVAASKESSLFEFMNNAAPFAMLGGANYIAESSVVAPSLLVDDLELERLEEEFPRPPLVPAPGAK